MNAIELVSKSYPVGLDVVGSTEKLNLPGAGRESLYHAVDLIWFVTGGTDLEVCV